MNIMIIIMIVIIMIIIIIKYMAITNPQYVLLGTFDLLPDFYFLTKLMPVLHACTLPAFFMRRGNRFSSDIKGA